MDLSSNGVVKSAQRDVRDLLARADRLERGHRGSEAAPLLRAVMKINEQLDGRDVDRSVRTVLARCFQHLHAAQGATLPASMAAEASGDELAAAVLKAAVDPHTTTNSGLANTIVGPMILAMAPSSLFYRHLKPYELPLGVNSIYFPRFAQGSPTVGWIGEGGAIPATSGLTDGVTLSVQKVGSLLPVTNELLSRTQFASLLEDAILKSVGQAVDARFFSNTTLVNSPAGIFSLGNGTSVAGSAVTTAAGVVADLTALIASAVTAGVPLAQASFVFNPLTLAKLQGSLAGGVMPFANATQFANIPFETSVGMPVGRVGLVAWDALIALTQGLPRISLSANATLHMETVPVSDISVATPTTSVFQRDMQALRVLMPAGFASTNAAAALYVDAVAWD